MKELDELILPDDLRYAENHEWARMEDNKVRVGITDYAQDQLGDIVFIDLPKVGETMEKGTRFGTVESVKAVSELFMPVGGEILALNEELDGVPGLVNQSPYEGGWMILVKPDNLQDLEKLMTHEAYLEMLKGLE